jgi:hypothetical protein
MVMNEIEIGEQIWADRERHGLTADTRPWYGDLPEIKAFRIAFAHILEASDLETAQRIAANALKLRFPVWPADGGPLDPNWPASLLNADGS